MSHAWQGQRSRVGPRICGALLGFLLSPLALWLLVSNAEKFSRGISQSPGLPITDLLLKALPVGVGILLLALICWLARLSSLAPAFAALWLIPSVVSLIVPDSYFFFSDALRTFGLRGEDLYNAIVGSSVPIGVIFVCLAVTTAILRARPGNLQGRALTGLLATLLGAAAVIAGILALAVSYHTAIIALDAPVPRFELANTLLATAGLLLFIVGFACAARHAGALILAGLVALFMSLWWVFSITLPAGSRPPYWGNDLAPALTTLASSGVASAVALMLLAAGLAVSLVKRQAAELR